MSYYRTHTVATGTAVVIFCPGFPLQTPKPAEAKGQVQRMGSQAMHGLERLLLEHVVANAEPGNPDSVP